MVKSVRVYEPKMVFERYKKLGAELILRALGAYSYWVSSYVYPLVIERTPKYKGTDPRRKPGTSIRPYIKIMWTKGEFGIRYKTIGVPGGTAKGTPPYHALMAIKSLHEGRAPFTVRTTRPMTFPLKRGETFRNPKTAAHAPGVKRGPKRWVITKKVEHKAWPKSKYPWIYEAALSQYNVFLKILRMNAIKAAKRGRKIRIEIS